MRVAVVPQACLQVSLGPWVSRNPDTCPRVGSWAYKSSQGHLTGSLDTSLLETYCHQFPSSIWEEKSAVHFTPVNPVGEVGVPKAEAGHVGNLDHHLTQFRAISILRIPKSAYFHYFLYKFLTSQLILIITATTLRSL